MSTSYIPDKMWNRYKSIIKDFMRNDAAKQPAIWARHIDQMLAYAEDSTPQYLGTNLEVLCFYNSFRNWPINRATVSGELDEENMVIYVTKEIIGEIGHLNKDGYWDLNWVEDRFMINGQIYKPAGDTEVAQAKDEALCFILILKRDRDTHLIFDGEEQNIIMDDTLEDTQDDPEAEENNTTQD